MQDLGSNEPLRITALTGLSPLSLVHTRGGSQKRRVSRPSAAGVEGSQPCLRYSPVQDSIHPPRIRIFNKRDLHRVQKESKIDVVYLESPILPGHVVRTLSAEARIIIK